MRTVRSIGSRGGAGLMCLLLCGALVAATPVASAPAHSVLFIPLLGYRTGPFAPGGSGILGGQEDYLALLNARGGLDGLTFRWTECEFAYDTARGVECYERYKKDLTFVFPSSTGVAYALLDRSVKDKIPLVTVGYGRSDATDGKTFPWSFPILGNYWSQVSSFIRYLAAREGGEAKLRGKRIALLHLDIPYGREPIPMLQAMSKHFGFEFRNFPLPMPGLEQSAAWVDIARRFRADYVLQWNWGASCTVPFRALAEVGFPIDRFMGVWWCGSEEDVRPAANLAKGYVSANFTGVGRNFPVIQQILNTVYKAGKGNIAQDRVGTVYYDRGVVWAIVITEAMRNGIQKFGLPVTGEKMRWGLEHLNITEARLKELGALNLMPTVVTSPEDHGGVTPAYMQRWDGKEWVRIPGLWQPYADMVWQLVRESAAQFQEQKK